MPSSQAASATTRCKRKAAFDLLSDRSLLKPTKAKKLRALPYRTKRSANSNTDELYPCKKRDIIPTISPAFSSSLDLPTLSSSNGLESQNCSSPAFGVSPTPAAHFDSTHCESSPTWNATDKCFPIECDNSNDESQPDTNNSNSNSNSDNQIVLYRPPPSSVFPSFSDQEIPDALLRCFTPNQLAQIQRQFVFPPASDSLPRLALPPNLFYWKFDHAINSDGAGNFLTQLQSNAQKFASSNDESSRVTQAEDVMNDDDDEEMKII